MTKSKAVLGKGLNALLSRRQDQEIDIKKDNLSDDDGRSEMIARIETDKIKPNPFQPRLDFNPVALEELKKSILQKGVIQPITVRRAEDDAYELISGERRLRAATEAGLKEVPAYIINVSSTEEMLEIALVENLQREHLNSIEIALSYQRLVNDLQYTQEEVARKIGKDRTTVTNFIRLLKLPGDIQESLRKEEMNMGHARALLSLPDEESRLKLWKKIVQQGLSVRKVEQQVKSILEPSSKTKNKNKSTESRETHLETQLRRTFGTKVSVKTRSDGGGEIAIEFYSSDDLERLLDLVDLIDRYKE